MFGALSVVLYKPWRRRIDRQRSARRHVTLGRPGEAGVLEMDSKQVGTVTSQESRAAQRSLFEELPRQTPVLTDTGVEV